MQGHPSACTQAEFGMFNDEPLAEHSWDFPVYTGERGTSKGWSSIAKIRTTSWSSWVSAGILKILELTAQ